MNERFELFSPLTPEECAKRLSAAIASIASDRSARTISPTIIAGEIICGTVENVHLELWHHSHSEAPTTHLTATIEPCDGGTLISGEFHWSRSERVGQTFFRGFIFLWGGLSITASLYGAIFGETNNRLVAFIVPVVCFGFTYGMLAAFRYTCRVEPGRFMEFLRCNLETK